MSDDFALLVEQVEKRRAEKVATFLELLRDPDLAAYVALLRNGQHPQHSQQTKPSFTAPPGFKTGNGIQKTVLGLVLPERFTADDVLRGLQEGGFAFTGKDHKAAVRDALTALTRGEAPSFRIAHKGEGGKLNIYERIR